MLVDLHINESFFLNRGLNASVKSIEPGQPRQPGQNFFAINNSYVYQRTIVPCDSFVC